MNEIASAQNARFKNWQLLLESRGIKKQGLALLAGRKLIEEFLRQRPQDAVELLTSAKLPEFEFAERVFLTSALFKALDLHGTGFPLLVVKARPLPTWASAPAQGLELIVALSDPGNLGAVLRSAEAFGARRVILTEECSSAYLPKALRAASGATFRVPLARTGPLATVAASPLYALDLVGQNLKEFAWPENLFLVLGEEGRGVPAKLRCTSLSIATATHTESLNAMAAASIALFSYRSRWS